ncbi:MAG: leucine-rich repeat domain-containing protein [Bacteroidetes bacterium]|jgi:Leucine-rich repeat (LRR) protein|nr:leucine-rich repeat domain-containing protein [Bacteroidota bacterium]
MRFSLSILFLLTLTFSSVDRLRAQEGIQNNLYPLRDSITLDTMIGYTDLAAAMREPEKVVKLVLRKEKYKEFPKEIWSFPNLQYLDLSKNQITEFPDSLGKLKSLQVLHLSKNKIEALPRELGDCQNLVLLDINQNELTMLPPQIGKLKKLKYLDLWSNSISIFPDELKDISDNLKVMDLRVILINYSVQDRLHKLLPNTLIYMDAPCHCNQ